MRIYLTDEKCQECKGKRARLIQVVERGSNVGAATYEDCPRCSGVGLEPRELVQAGWRKDFVGTFGSSGRRYKETYTSFHAIEDEGEDAKWHEDEGWKPVYRMEEAKPMSDPLEALADVLEACEVEKKRLQAQLQQTQARLEGSIRLLNSFKRAEIHDTGMTRRGTLDHTNEYPVDRNGKQLWRFVGDALLLASLQEESENTVLRRRLGES